MKRKKTIVRPDGSKEIIEEDDQAPVHHKNVLDSQKKGEPPAKQYLDKVASKGQGGDTQLAHVNNYEAMLLKKMGGAGTINPRTGLRQFYSTTAPTSQADVQPSTWYTTPTGDIAWTGSQWVQQGSPTTYNWDQGMALFPGSTAPTPATEAPTTAPAATSGSFSLAPVTTSPAPATAATVPQTNGVITRPTTAPAPAATTPAPTPASVQPSTWYSTPKGDIAWTGDKWVQQGSANTYGWEEGLAMFPGYTAPTPTPTAPATPAGSFDISPDIKPFAISGSQSTSGLPGQYQEQLLSSLMPQLQSSITNMPGNYDAYTNQALGSYQQMMDNALRKNIPTSIANMANRGIINSTEGNKILSDTYSNAAIDASSKGYTTAMASALGKAGMPSILGQLAQLGNGTNSNSFSYQEDPTKSYAIMADLIKGMM